MSDPTISGHCVCGAVTYSAPAGTEPMMTAICHCDDCKRSSGAPFSLNVVIDRDVLELRGDALKTFKTVGADTGLPRERMFCGDCGSQVLTVLDEAQEMAIIKAGTLDDASWVQPEMEVFTECAQPWVHDEGAEERGMFPRGIPT